MNWADYYKTMPDIIYQNNLSSILLVLEYQLLLKTLLSSQVATELTKNLCLFIYSIIFIL